MDLPEQMRDDVTRHVILVELDKGVSGLGFCIKGGKQSPSGDQPVIVKRIFRCMYLDDELIPIYFTFMTCSLIRRLHYYLLGYCLVCIFGVVFATSLCFSFIKQ